MSNCLFDFPYLLILQFIDSTQRTTSAARKINNLNANLFPNPTSRFLKINEYAEILEVRISDPIGRIFSGYTIKNGLLDLNDLPPGTYQLSTKSKKGIRSYQFIKK